MYMNFIIRYANNHFIETLRVNSKDERDAIINMIEKLGYEYVVIANKGEKDSKFSINCMLDFEDFKIGSDK